MAVLGTVATLYPPSWGYTLEKEFQMNLSLLGRTLLTLGRGG